MKIGDRLHRQCSLKQISIEGNGFVVAKTHVGCAQAVVLKSMHPGPSFPFRQPMLLISANAFVRNYGLGVPIKVAHSIAFALNTLYSFDCSSFRTLNNSGIRVG